MTNWRVLVAFVAACSSPKIVSPDAADPSDMPLQILVSDRSVWVYTNAANLEPCFCVPTVFPTIDTCTYLTDANPCSDNPNCHSCFTDFAVEVDGTRLSSPEVYGQSDPLFGFYDPFPVGQLSLVLTGCGRGTVRIPLDGAPNPTPTVTAEYVGGLAATSWSTDLPSNLALLTLEGGLGGPMCLALDVHQFAFRGWPTAMAVTVQAFGSAVNLQTPFGAATLWRGNSSYAKFPLPTARKGDQP